MISSSVRVKVIMENEFWIVEIWRSLKLLYDGEEEGSGMVEKRKSNYGFWCPTITTGGKKQESFTLKRLLSCGVSYLQNLRSFVQNLFGYPLVKGLKARELEVPT